MRLARWMFFALMLAPAPALALDDPQCLSQSEVKGGHPRYHIVNGEKCWYASPSGAPRRPSAATSDGAQEPQAATNAANPYGDPSWDAAEPKRRTTKPRQPTPGGMGGPLILNPSSAYSR